VLYPSFLGLQGLVRRRIAIAVGLALSAAAANAWWSRGRGFGWKALGAVVVLAVAGY